MNEREPRWDRDSTDGYQGELFAQWAEDAINAGASHEVKYDLRSLDTGNVFIERECRISGQWMPSGIAKTEADLWAHIVVGPIVIFAPSAFVRYIAERHGRHAENKRGSNPTRGWILPIPEFVDRLADLGSRWLVNPNREPPQLPVDDLAPFGRLNDGRPWAPYGLRADGKPRLQAGGRRARKAS